MNFIIMFLLGGTVDTPVTQYEEMFLPDKLQEHLSSFDYRFKEKRQTETGEKERKAIVIDTTVIAESSNEQMTREDPPRYLGLHGLIGILLSLPVIAALILKKKGIQEASFIYRAYISVPSLVFGLMGFVLFFMSFFTDHTVTYGNENLFYINPLLLVAFLFSLPRRGNRKRKLPVKEIIFTGLTLSTLVLVLLKLFFGYRQENGEYILLLLPLYIAAGPVMLLTTARMKTTGR